MSPEARDAFLAVPRTAVIATVDAHGRPHAVAVWFRWVEGELRIVTGRDSTKARNIARNGRAEQQKVPSPATSSLPSTNSRI